MAKRDRNMPQHTAPAGTNGPSSVPEVTGPFLVNADNQGKPLIVVHQLHKTYAPGQTQVHALRGVSLEISYGEFVAIRGPSGSGKSTFMNLIGCLDRPSQGEYWLEGRLVSQLSNRELAHVRNRLIGFVFQGFNLLSRASARSNVELPMIYAGLSRQLREQRARQALQLVGLGSHQDHKPTQLSGGEQQRVAIARALVNAPSLLLADEPTGNLDTGTGGAVLDLLRDLHSGGTTIALITHDREIAAALPRRVEILDGRIRSRSEEHTSE